MEFTIDILTGMGPLLGWGLGLCTYRTPLESALVDPREEEMERMRLALRLGPR
jgi:hypothetical protein